MASVGQDCNRRLVLLSVHVDSEPLRVPGVFQPRKKFCFVFTPFRTCAQFPEGLVFITRQVIGGMGELGPEGQ